MLMPAEFTDFAALYAAYAIDALFRRCRLLLDADAMPVATPLHCRLFSHFIDDCHASYAADMVMPLDYACHTLLLMLRCHINMMPTPSPYRAIRLLPLSPYKGSVLLACRRRQ